MSSSNGENIETGNENTSTQVGSSKIHYTFRGGEGCKMYCTQLQYRHTCTYHSQQGNPLLVPPPLVSHIEHEKEVWEESRNVVEESQQLETKVKQRLRAVQSSSCDQPNYLLHVHVAA